MKQRSFILVVTVVAAMLFGTIGVYAFDRARDDRIAKGVTVAGIDVGGMKTSEARTALQERLETPLGEPLVVRHRKERFRLSSERAGLRVDVGGMVDEAIERSRSGNLLSRSFREVTGGEVNADIPARVSYSEAAVDRLVKRVRDKVNRDPKDASVEPSGTGLNKVAGQNGIAVQTSTLADAVRSELSDPSGDRVVKAETKVTKPEVTTDELADKYPYYITVSRQTKELRFYKNLELQKTYRIAVGRVGFDTPSGLYHVQNKAVNPAWSVPEWGGDLAGQVIPGGTPQNPLKARWLGIYDGAGIHGTDDVASLGTAASHGCIRMAIPEVIELYDKTPVQTPVYIS